MSKSVTGPIPLTPATTSRHAASTMQPTGEMMPRPVTTTRRLDKRSPLVREIQNGNFPSGRLRTPSLAHIRGCLRIGMPAAPSLSLLTALVDVIDRLLDGCDLLGILVGNFRLEFFFQGHHQLDGVE